MAAESIPSTLETLEMLETPTNHLIEQTLSRRA
jgi:hypothetical protein